VYEIWGMQCKESNRAFSNMGLNGRGRKNVCFQRKNWPYLGHGER